VFKKVLLIFILFVLGQNLNAQLTIEITNIKEIKGRIELGLYNIPETYLSLTDQYKLIYHPVKNLTETIIIDTLPKGWYAISIMQDTNENGEMDKNFFRYPLEPYGFSNNYHPRISKPDFEDAEFYYNGKYLKLTIALIH